MKEENKKLLLKDLSARAPYGVKVSLQTCKRELTGVLDAVYPSDERVIVDNLSEAIAPINVRTGGFLVERDNVKPYLRPMSSMTEEENKQRKEFGILLWSDSNGKRGFDGFGNISGEDMLKAIDWLNVHHFDYRGLIEKGLALEAPEGMYEN